MRLAEARGAVFVDGVLGGGGDGRMAVQAQIVVAGKADQALVVAADDAVADAVARLEEGIVQAGILHVLDTAAQRAIARKIVNDAFALGLSFSAGMAVCSAAAEWVVIAPR